MEEEKTIYKAVKANNLTSLLATLTELSIPKEYIVAVDITACTAIYIKVYNEDKI